MRDYAINDEVFLVDAEALYRRMLDEGRSEAVAATARDCFLAMPHFMRSALSAIDEEYESTDEFLTAGLNIPEELLRDFRAKLLE